MGCARGRNLVDGTHDDCGLVCRDLRQKAPEGQILELIFTMSRSVVCGLVLA